MKKQYGNPLHKSIRAAASDENKDMAHRKTPASSDVVLFCEPILLSKEQAAAVMSISKSTLEKKIKEGKIATKRIGTRVLIPTRSLRNYVAHSMGEESTQRLPQQENCE